MVVEAVELQNGRAHRLGTHVTVDNVRLDLRRRLWCGRCGLLSGLFGQFGFLIGQIDFDTLSAVVVLRLVFEALLVDVEELLAHKALVVGYLDVARLAVELTGFLRDKSLARYRFLACHAGNIRDFLEIAQNCKVQFTRSGSILQTITFYQKIS